MTPPSRPMTAALCLGLGLMLCLPWIIKEPSAIAEPAAPEAAKIGADAPGFTLPDAVTGKDTRLADHKGKVVVLLFHSITCPYYKMNEGQGYDRAFVKMAERYKDKNVVFLGVNANSKETAKKIAKYHKKYEINYAVLKDEGNKVADAYGATVTPHVMVIDAAGKLCYRGGVEKHSGGPKGCGESETQYLAPVIDALLAGKALPVPTETKATGCKIKRG